MRPIRLWESNGAPFDRRTHPLWQDCRVLTPSPIARLWAVDAVRYLVVGGICFAFDFGLLWVLHQALGVMLAVATPVAFLASFALTYTLQRVVAFASSSRLVPSVGRYTALVAANTVATTAIVWGADRLGVSWEAGKVLAVVATTVWNYFAYRHWVFHAPAEGSTHV